MVFPESSLSSKNWVIQLVDIQFTSWWDKRILLVFRFTGVNTGIRKWPVKTLCDRILQQTYINKIRPNQIWCFDITQKWTSEGWFYLAVVLDMYSRRIVGWSTGSNMRTELPLRALNQALVLRGNPKGVIHHSDRGSQYTSEQYLKRQETAESTFMFWHTSFGSAGTRTVPRKLGLSPCFAQSR